MDIISVISTPVLSTGMHFPASFIFRVKKAIISGLYIQVRRVLLGKITLERGAIALISFGFRRAYAYHPMYEQHECDLSKALTSRYEYNSI